MTGGNAFEPSDIIIEVGDTIVWTTTGSLHTTTSGHPGDLTGLWYTPKFLNVGESFRQTFNELGEFPYFCRVHLSLMLGVVRVVENLEEAGPPPEPTPTRESGGGAASPGFDY